MWMTLSFIYFAKDSYKETVNHPKTWMGKKLQLELKNILFGPPLSSTNILTEALYPLMFKFHLKSWCF